jgi:hypothetical protein
VGQQKLCAYWHSLPDHPVLAGVHNQTYRAYASRGQADSVNAAAPLSAYGVGNRVNDVLFIVDAAMGSSRVSNGNRSFLAAFVADPARWVR